MPTTRTRSSHRRALQCLRVLATLVVEAVAECERQQREDTHMSLNLPRVKHACRAISRDLELEEKRVKELALNPELAKEVRRLCS